MIFGFRLDHSAQNSEILKILEVLKLISWHRILNSTRKFDEFLTNWIEFDVHEKFSINFASFHDVIIRQYRIFELFHFFSQINNISIFFSNIEFDLSYFVVLFIFFKMFNILNRIFTKIQEISKIRIFFRSNCLLTMF